MNEKKSIKVSLGTVICLFIIVILLIILAGMLYYYNRKDNNEIRQVNEYIETKNTIINTSINSITNNLINTINNTVNNETNTSFSEGTYSYLGSNYVTEGKLMISSMQKQITFSKNSFSANIGDFIIKGDYELANNNEIKCNIKSQSFIQNETPKEYSIDEKWTIIFSISNNKIKVKELNYDSGESELQIALGSTFGQEDEFIKYNEKDFINTWNSKYYYNLEAKKLSEDLRDIFGTSTQYGSYLKLLDNNKFEDYVHPVTESDKYRKGTYIFDGCNKITLKYDDNSYEREIYIIDNNTLQYEDGDVIIVLTK